MLRTIGSKIFAASLCLLLLMVTVAMLAIRNVSRVNDQVKEVVEYYAPLARSITNIDIHVLEQEILLERLFRLYEAEPRDIAAIKQETDGFQERGSQVDEEIVIAERLVAQGVEDLSREIDKIEMARLGPMLKYIEKEHQQLHDQAVKILAVLDQGATGQVSQLQERLAKEEDDYDLEIAKIRSELQRSTERSSLDTKRYERQIRQLNLAIIVGAAVLGLAFASIITLGLVRPIRRLLSGTKAVERGNLDVEVPATSRDEIGTLTQSFNHMVGELRMKERIKDTFGKYIDPRIVKDLIQQPDTAKPGGEKRVMTVLFCDMQGFTSLSEELTPGGLVNLLNQYFTMMSEPIRHYRGVIDKYIGDAVMAFWGSPFTKEEEHATFACLAALEQFSRLDEFRRLLPDLMGLRKGLPDINMRVGVATGEVVVGNIGSEISKSYTVMGDTVNIASRLEGAGKQYGVRLLISGETRKLAREAIETRELDSIQMLGKSEPVSVFELLARKGELDQATADLRDSFERGLSAYRDRDWGRAQTHFEACLRLNPGDAPAKLFIGRLQYLRDHPPAENWNGVWELTEK